MTVAMSLLLALTGLGLWAWGIGWFGLFVGRIVDKNFAKDYGYSFFFKLFLYPFIALLVASYAAKIAI